MTILIFPYESHIPGLDRLGWRNECFHQSHRFWTVFDSLLVLWLIVVSWRDKYFYQFHRYLSRIRLLPSAVIGWLITARGFNMGALRRRFAGTGNQVLSCTCHADYWVNEQFLCVIRLMVLTRIVFLIVTNFLKSTTTIRHKSTQKQQ